MFCGKCGNEVPDGDEFCWHCGSKVGRGDTRRSEVPSAVSVSGKEQGGGGAPTNQVTLRARFAPRHPQSDSASGDKSTAFVLPSSWPPKTLAGCGLGLLTLIGVFLPWGIVRGSVLGVTGSISAAGTQTGYGILALVMGIISLLLGFLFRGKVWSLSLFAAGLVCLVDLIAFGVNVSGAMANLDTSLSTLGLGQSSLFSVSVSAGVGFWSSLVGAVGVMLLGATETLKLSNSMLTQAVGRESQAMEPWQCPACGHKANVQAGKSNRYKCGHCGEQMVLTSSKDATAESYQTALEATGRLNDSAKETWRCTNCGHSAVVATGKSIGYKCRYCGSAMTEVVSNDT